MTCTVTLASDITESKVSYENRNCYPLVPLVQIKVQKYNHYLQIYLGLHPISSWYCNDRQYIEATYPKCTH